MRIVQRPLLGERYIHHWPEDGDESCIDWILRPSQNPSDFCRIRLNLIAPSSVGFDKLD
jgi:hypothetical protein